jgi:hypothetical protein
MKMHIQSGPSDDGILVDAFCGERVRYSQTITRMGCTNGVDVCSVCVEAREQHIEQPQSVERRTVDVDGKQVEITADREDYPDEPTMYLGRDEDGYRWYYDGTCDAFANETIADAMCKAWETVHGCTVRVDGDAEHERVVLAADLAR